MKKIIIGVSGGIASYKSADLASKLVQHGMDVNVCIPKFRKIYYTINI